MSNHNVHERFWAKVDTSQDCWLWTGAKGSNGYGSFWLDYRWQRAHRAAHEMHVGPIPAGMEIDHTCHVVSCVRPDHLRVVTPKQNQENKAGLARNNTSGVRGVHWHPRAQKWRAEVSHFNQRVYVGLFDTLDEAAEAVRQTRLALHTHNDEDRASSTKLAVRSEPRTSSRYERHAPS